MQRGAIFKHSKKLGLGHKFKFLYSYVFATWWCKPLIFQTWRFDLDNQSFKCQQSLRHLVAKGCMGLENQKLLQRVNSCFRLVSCNFCCLLKKDTNFTENITIHILFIMIIFKLPWLAKTWLHSAYLMPNLYFLLFHVSESCYFFSFLPATKYFNYFHYYFLPSQESTVILHVSYLALLFLV